MPKLRKGCGESGLKFPAPKMARTYIGQCCRCLDVDIFTDCPAKSSSMRKLILLGSVKLHAL
jgi:hypothetical protein